MTSSHRIHSVLAKYFGADLVPELAERFETLHLQGGDWLFHQGEPGDSLYLLARGRLQAWLEEDGGEPQLLGEIAPGDSVGEMGLLSGMPRSAGVRAVRDSLLVRIDRAHFDAVAAGHPGLVMQLATNVVGMAQRKGRGSAYRRPRTLAVIPLDSGAHTRSFGEKLANALRHLGAIASLGPDVLESHPPAATAEPGRPDVPESLREWLHEQEDTHEFTLFQCTDENGVWTELAKRQADLLLFVADGGSHPGVAAAHAEAWDDNARHALVLLQPGTDQPIAGTAAWLDALAVDFHLHVRRDVQDDLARVARVVSGRAVGLVLAAGAARGFAHIGVFRALRELGIPVDWVGGASIGSIMGAAFAAGWDMDRIMRTARLSFVEGKPFSDYTMPVTSLISGRRMNRLLRNHLDIDIEDLPIPFFCVSAVLDDGSLNVHHRGNTARALAASAALPGVLPPAVVNRRLTIDGSVLNSLPVDIMERQPVGRIVAVDLSSTREYHVDYPQVPPAWKILAGRYLPFLERYRVPALATVMLKATEIGTLGRMRELGKRADLLLRPDVRNFGITEIRTFDRIVDAGYRCAMEELPRWMERREKEEGRQV